MDKRAATVLALIGTFLVATASDVTQATPKISSSFTMGKAKTITGNVTNKPELRTMTINATSTISSSPTFVKGMNTPTNTSTSPGPVANTTKVSNTTEVSKEMNTPTNTSTSPGTVDNTTKVSNTTEVSKDISTPGPDKDKSPSSPNNTPGSVGPTTPQGKPKPSKESDGSNALTYIIVFSIVIVCLVGAIVYCCFQSKTRRFSLDHHGKHEDAEIPLSQVDPEVFEASPAKATDMQTFSAAESSLSDTSAPPADGQEIQEGDKAVTNTNQQEKESSTDTQATLPLTEKPSELTVVDLNDGEPDISTKTSVESLDEPVNENNSNNRAYSGWKMYDFSGHFTEIHLDDGP